MFGHPTLSRPVTRLMSRPDVEVVAFTPSSNLASAYGIAVTGAIVRVTASGLGCPTWPTCTADSLVPTAEMGIHGAIEFGNRMMTSVVGIAALIVFQPELRSGLARLARSRLVHEMEHLPESELVSGYNVEYSAMGFALFFLAEYAGMVTTSCVLVALFWGGWHLPWIEWLWSGWQVSGPVSPAAEGAEAAFAINTDLIKEDLR